jgi:hypothetical protein
VQDVAEDRLGEVAQEVVDQVVQQAADRGADAVADEAERVRDRREARAGLGGRGRYREEALKGVGDDGCLRVGERPATTGPGVPITVRPDCRNSGPSRPNFTETSRRVTRTSRRPHGRGNSAVKFS